MSLSSFRRRIKHASSPLHSAWQVCCWRAVRFQAPHQCMIRVTLRKFKLWLNQLMLIKTSFKPIQKSWMMKSESSSFSESCATAYRLSKRVITLTSVLNMMTIMVQCSHCCCLVTRQHTTSLWESQDEHQTWWLMLRWSVITVTQRWSGFSCICCISRSFMYTGIVALIKIYLHSTLLQTLTIWRLASQ